MLFAAAAAAVLTGGFVAFAPNRLLSGRPVGFFDAAGIRFTVPIVALSLILLAGAWVRPSRALYRSAAVLSALLLLLVLSAAGAAAAAVTAGGPALARVSLGAAFWVLVGATSLAVVDGLQRAEAGDAERLAFIAAIIAALGAMAWAGLFDSLSLTHEYRVRHDLFTSAVVQHIALVAGAVVPAVLVGFPLGVAAVRRPHWQGPVFAVLNLLQTVPSIALFGLLIGPLAALAEASPALAAIGVGGIGPAPAVIALILYALLPVVRNTVAGIGEVDPAVVDAARGMGMTQRQIFWRAELPLSLPLLLAGLRIVLVQAIGLAVVAALIGAGGLGSFVFEGLGQSAADLVLLGALPAIALALVADFLLQMLAAVASRR